MNKVNVSLILKQCQDAKRIKIKATMTVREIISQKIIGPERNMQDGFIIQYHCANFRMHDLRVIILINILTSLTDASSPISILCFSLGVFTVIFIFLEVDSSCPSAILDSEMTRCFREPSYNRRSVVRFLSSLFFVNSFEIVPPALRLLNRSDFL